MSADPSNSSKIPSPPSSGSTTPSEPTAKPRSNLQAPSSSSSLAPQGQSDDRPSSQPSGNASAFENTDPLTEELPPAYTAAPDVTSGEQTVQFGPRRAFQAAPPPRVNPYLTPQWQAPQQTGTGWSSYPGQSYSQPTTPQNSRHAFVPPPTHPLSPSRETRVVTMTPVNPAHPDFVRDFYAAGTGSVDSALMGGPSQMYTSPSANASTTRTHRASSSQSSLPILPTRPSSESGHSTESSRANHMRQPSASGSRSDPPDDGSPTNVPVPGHPLLNHGNILVYPAGHECHKCHNTGYKGSDPTHPCKKCWPKFGKPYSGAIMYSPWSNSSTQSASGKQFQRPLPKSDPPQRRHQPSSSYLARPKPPQNNHNSGYPGVAATQVIPTGAGSVPMGPYLGGTQQPYSSHYASVGQTMVGYQPPPGSIVVRPGDPRIGGSLCWRCGGSGTISFLIFDESICTVCGGAGRTF